MEIHIPLKGQVFSTIFDLIKSRSLIGLSGTLSPEDEKILQQYIPLGDEISFAEGKRNGWVSNIIEYDLALTLSDSEQEKYNEINELCEKYFAYFGQSFDLARQCWSYSGALKYVVEGRVQIRDPFGRLLSNSEVAKDYASKANMWRNYLRQRSDFIHNSIDKVNAVAYILNNLPDRKAFTFGYKTDTCDKLMMLVPNSDSIHSNKKSIKIQSTKLVTITGKRQNELSIIRFIEDKARALHSVKALDLGIDVKGVNCAIIYGRDSNSHKASQRQWRATRLEEEDKLALLVNVYLVKTQDQKWHERIQGRKKVPTFTSAEELVNDFKNKIC